MRQGKATQGKAKIRSVAAGDGDDGDDEVCVEIGCLFCSHQPPFFLLRLKSFSSSFHADQSDCVRGGAALSLLHWRRRFFVIDHGCEGGDGWGMGRKKMC